MIKKKDLQANIGRKGKWIIVLIAVILISVVLYFSIWSIKVHTLYKLLKDDNKELDIERPYLKPFLNEVEKKWKEI